MRFRRLALAVAVAVTGGCSSPSGPTPPPPVDPGPVVNNTPPVIGKFTVQGTRPNEPPDFADASEEVTVTVDVTDAESAITSLRFNWTSDVGGTFTGTGNKVTWKAPASVTAPTTAKLTVEVVETYTSQGKSVENRPTGSTMVSLHDSVKEVGDLATLFLLDFSDSSKDTTYVMRNFHPTCYGTGEETGDVARNRENYTIIDKMIGTSRTTVGFGGICAFRSKPGDACARVPSYWKSIAKQNVYDQFGQLVAVKGQQTETPFGTDQVAAMYYKDLKQWKLCDSQYDPDHTSLKAPSLTAPSLWGLVP
jgi:hypothetical protein